MIPEWLNIFLALGGSAIISTAVAYMFNKVVKAFEERQYEIRQLEITQREQRHQERAEAFHAELLNELSETLMPIRTDIAEISKSLSLNNKGAITNIRALLKVLHDQYVARGYADTGDKATWFELLDNYRALGGNHFKEYVDMWCENIEKLPLEPPKKNKEK